MSFCFPRLKASVFHLRIACLFAFLLLVSLGGVFGQARAAGITLVQHVGKDAGTTTTSTLAFSGANSTGNFIAVVIRGGLSNTQVFTVKDSNANVYKQAKQIGSSGSAVTSAIYYAENIAGGSNTITVTMTVSGPLRFAILEYSGVATSNSLDVTVAASTTSTSPNSGNLTTSLNGELLLGEVATADSTAFTGGAGFTVRDFVPAEPGTKLITEDQIQATAGVASATATLNPSSNWAALLAAFKPASGVAPPSIASLSPTSGPVGTSVTISGSSFGASQGTSTVTFNGAAATPTSWSATSIVVPVPTGATSGNVVVTVGGVPTNSVAFTVIVPPSITNLSPTFGPLGISVTITGANFGASQGTSTVTFNGVAATPTSWSATSILVPVPSGATTGNVVVTVSGLASNGVLFSVGPNITSISPTSGPVGTLVNITGTSFGATQGASTVSFGSTTATPTSWSATSIVAPVPAGASSGSVMVFANGIGSNHVLFTVIPTPNITILSQTSGPVGTSVTINGSNFGASQGTSTVTFNGTTATPTSWSATSIVVPVPNGATSGNVIVTVGGLASNGVSFTVLVPPSIANLSPVSGPVSTSVTINGANFGASQGTSTVTFNGTAANPTSWSATSIVVPVPSGATSGNVIVTVSGLASNGVLFTVLVPPSITNLSPASGPVGTSFTITGTSFGATQGSSTVTLNGTALPVTSWTSTSIAAFVPNGATTGNVVVTVSGLASNGLAFTVVPTPSITSLSPTSGPIGTSVTITGANFGASQGTSTVTFNGTAANPTSWSATSIVVPVPNGATSGNVIVTVSGLASNSVLFTVLAPPTISNLSPNVGSVGTSVTITGTNFGPTQGSSTVTFNGTLATPTSWNGTGIVVTVPLGATTGNVVVTVNGLSSNGAPFTVNPISVSLSPTTVTLGTGAQQIFSLTIQNDVLGNGVTWSLSGAGCSSTACGTIQPFNAAPGEVYTAPATAPNPPTVTLTATSITDPTKSAAATITVVQATAPTITGLNPASGPLGSSVTITGTNFGNTQGSSVLWFNSTQVAPASWSNTTIVATVPASLLGNVNALVQVVVLGLPSNQVNFSITPAPTITSLNPTAGPVTSSVKISGGNFGASQGTSTVTFNGTLAAPSSWTNTAIFTTVPSGATSGNVVVTVASVASNGVAFTVTAGPLISNLSPATGPSGTSVTISGTGFGATQGTSSITFGSLAASVTSWSDTSIVAVVPVGLSAFNNVGVAVTVSGATSNTVIFGIAPSITSLSPPSGPVGTSVTITGNNFGLSQGTSTVTFNGTPATPTSWNPTSIVVPVPAGATTGNAVVTASSFASNGVLFTVPPSIASLSPTSAPVGNSVTITGTSFGATQGTSTVTFNGGAATPTSWSDTSIVVVVPNGALTGNVVVTVGGLASNGVLFTFIPNITSLSPTSGSAGQLVTITGTAFSGSQGTVTFNGVSAVVPSWSNTSIQADVPSLVSAGPANVVVTAGGSASNSQSFNVAPLIAGLSPLSGPAGTSVTITGSSFGSSQGSSTITFNGVTATPTSWSASSIVTPVPSGATNGNVVVTVAGLASGGVYFAPNPPNISSLSPTSGPAGTVVTITGTFFGATQGTSIVSFAGVNGTPTNWSDTSITVPVPAGAAIGNDLLWVTVHGVGSNQVIFTVPSPNPFISNLSPASGPVGTSVTITGTNFGATQGTSTVTFSGTAATPTSWSATSIFVPVPIGATTGNLVVTVNSLVSNNVTFTVIPPAPTITSLSPTSGPVGTPVTITGTNFGTSQGTSTVTFNGTAATPTSWGTTSIVVPVPSGATTGNVVVTVAGQASNAVAFTVTNPGPSITSLSPTSGPVGSSVFITGTSFGPTLGSSTVTFNGTAATIFGWTSTSASVVVPSGATSGNVVVTVNGVASNGVAFTVTPPPNITALSPTSGPVGSSVTITGANFGASQGTGTVTFNGSSATPTSWSAGSIVVPVPTGGITGPVFVTVPGGVASNGVLFTVTAPPAPIALVQHIGKDAGTTTTTTLSFNSANTAGNFIAVAIRGGLSNSQVFTVKDSNSNTYKQAKQISSSGSAVTSAIYYAENIKSGANTITVTMSVSGPLRIDILEYSGVATSNSLDATAAATTTSTSPNSGSLTTTANGDLLLGEVATADSDTFTAGAGYTIRDFVPVEPNTKLITEDQIQSSAGTASGSATLSVSSNWGAILAAFKAAGGTGGGAGTPASITATAGTPQSVTVNAAFATQLQATVKDSSNNPVSGVTVTFTAPGSGASGTFAGGVTTATTNASGVATAAIFTANTIAGSYNVTASVSGVATSANFSLTNLAGTASSITATAGTPQSATINTAFAAQLQATVKDSFNNPVSGVTVTFAAPVSGASGTFAGGVNTATTNASGIATPPVFTANGLTGSYTVTASASGVASPANFSLTNVSAPPASISATAGTPQSATVNTAFATAFQVTVKDASNNPVSNVTVTFAAPGSGASGTFAGGVNTATTNSSGIATPAVFTANAVAGTYTLTASVAGVGTPANFSLTNLAGPAANIAATAGTPQSAVINTAFATQLQAAVTDSLNNPVSGVTVTFTAPASGASGAFAGGVNTATTNAQGVATAPAFTANATVGGPYTVSASAPGVATQATFSLTNLSSVSNITLVQHRNMDASTQTNNSLAFANNTTAGNFIAVAIRGSGSSSQVFTVSDSSGNTYHQAFSVGLTASLETFAIFYAENIHGGADKITVAQSVLGTLRFAILEYSGAATSNSLDGTATAQGSNTSPNSGNLTTTANGDLLLATIITKNSGTYTAAGNYNIEETIQPAPYTKIVAEDQLQSAAGSVSAGVSLGASDIWGAGLAAFRSISGAVAPISVSVSPTSATIPGGYGTQALTATTTNDFLNRGVTWALSGVGCSGIACGTLLRVTTTSVLYTAPSSIPSPATVSLTATSIADSTKSASATITVTQGVLTVVVSPKRAAATVSSSPVQFTGNVYNDAQNLGVTWQVDGNNGGTAASGTISASGLYTPGTQPGQHTITAVSNANASVSGSALMAVTDLAGVYTNHNDNARTGQNLKEYGLTTATVTPSTFGQLFSCPVDGYVYAQPLWVANLNFSGVMRNVVFIATEHESVYAFDADSPNCVQLWKTNFLSSGVTTLTSADVGSNTDIIPEIGITSTPVIDPATNTLYVVPKTRETVGTVNGQACSAAAPCYVHRLHALDLITGAEKTAFNSPVVISATNFVPQKHLQRPALLLANNTVYLAFGSHGDLCNYQGWLMGYNAGTLAQTFASAVSNPASGCNQDSIWQSGGGPSADASGNVYVVTANGLYDGTSNFGDTVLKFNATGSMPPADWFTPFNQATLAANDVDLGSAAVLILPDAVGSAAHPHLAITTGKDAVVYLLDQTNMGKFNSSSNNDVQELVPVPPANTTLDDGGNYVGPAYWNGNFYLTGQNYPLMQFQISNGVIATPQFASSSNTFPPRGGAPVVSANGATGGIVWIIDYSGFQDNTPAILDAYDANNVGTLLFSSPASGAGAAGNGVKFSAPTVANSKVYLGGQFVFTVYGLLPN